MNRSDLIRKVSRKSKVPQTQVEEILDSIIGTIESALASGDSVVLKNFGKWEIRERESIMRRNPRTGADIKVPAKRGLLFHAAPALKQNVQVEEDGPCIS